MSLLHFDNKGSNMAPVASKSRNVESPGPKSRAALDKLDRVWDARTAHFVADYKKSSNV